MEVVYIYRNYFNAIKKTGFDCAVYIFNISKYLFCEANKIHTRSPGRKRDLHSLGILWDLYRQTFDGIAQHSTQRLKFA